MFVALKCPHCQGALSAPAPGQTVVNCPWCGVGLAVSPPPAAAAPSRDEMLRLRFGKMLSALRGEQPFPDALRGALEKTLPDKALAAGVARAMVRILEHFHQQNGLDVSGDDNCVQRLFQAWMNLRTTLAQSNNAELNLPYFTADASGPKHLQRAVSRADLAALEA